VRSISKNEFGALRLDCLETLKGGGKLIASGLGKNVPMCEKSVGTLNWLKRSKSIFRRLCKTP